MSARIRLPKTARGCEQTATIVESMARDLTTVSDTLVKAAMLYRNGRAAVAISEVDRAIAFIEFPLKVYRQDFRRSRKNKVTKVEAPNAKEHGPPTGRVNEPPVTIPNQKGELE